MRQPGVALFTALLSKAQLLVRSTVDANPADVDHWYVCLELRGGG